MCVYILFEYLGLHLGVIVFLYMYEWIIYIFTGEVIKGTSNIFNRSHYHFWYTEIRNKFLSVIIDTEYKMFVLNKINENISRSGTTNPKKNLMVYVVSVIEIIQNFYLETWELGIVKIIMWNQNGKNV